MPDAQPSPHPLLTTLRVLLFRASRDELAGLGRIHLAWGLGFTWLVGMGRYWDDPGAHVFQHLGAGSLLYVVVLAGLLWAVMWPLRPQRWRYAHVLTFVTLTSLPAALYAIPVERFTELSTARSLNAWFLAAVATWRVALLGYYLRRHGELGWPAVVVGGLLPLSAIVTALTALNLQRAVFDIMGGLRGDGTAADSAYGVLLSLTVLSWMALPILALIYAALIWTTQRARARARARRLDMDEDEEKGAPRAA